MDPVSAQLSSDRTTVLAHALELMPVAGLLIDDTRAQAITANCAALTLLGLAHAGGRSIEQGTGAIVVHRNGRRVALDDWLRRQYRRGRPRQGLELRIERGDGARIDVLVSIVVLRDHRARRHGVLASLADVTAQNVRCRRAEHRARQWQALTRLGLRALSEPRVEQVMQRVCARLANLLGAEFSALLRRLPDSRDLVLAGGVGWQPGLIDRALISLDQVSAMAADAVPLWREHGIISSAKATVTGPGGPYGELTVHSTQPRDFGRQDRAVLRAAAAIISGALQREDLAQRLAERREQLARVETDAQIERAARLASLGAVAAGIAHEVNNPLNSILMNAELGLLHLDSNDHGRVVTVLRRIIEDCRRCADITRSLLMSTRADRHALHEPTDLNRVVQSARGLMASILQLSGLKILLELDEDMPLIAANRIELEQVLVNLTQNASEAGASRVIIGTQRRAGAVELRVADDGPGVLDADLPHLFNPFFSARRDGSGTGLGLNLVQRIINRHGGAITARNRHDGGMEFVASLPIEAQSDESRTRRRG